MEHARILNKAKPEDIWSAQYTSPLVEAEQVYGRSAARYIQERGKKFQTEHAAPTLPIEVLKEMPSYNLDQWREAVPVVSMREGLIPGSSRARSITEYGIGEDGKAVHTKQGLLMGGGVGGEGHWEREGPGPSQISIGHELHHTLQRKTGGGQPKKGVQTLSSEGGRAARLANAADDLPETTSDERWYKEGAQFAASWDQGEVVAHVAGAVRLFGNKYQRPPESPEEVREAMEMMKETEKRLGPNSNQFYDGFFDVMERIDWIEKIGQYLVQTEPTVAKNLS
jgi:hypothetical protein